MDIMAMLMARKLGGGNTGGGGNVGGGDLQKSTVGDLKLFDVVKFGQWDGRNLCWFVSDMDYEGHVIVTALDINLFTLSFCTYDSATIENKQFASNYGLSNIRQFLNSDATEWYSEKFVGNTPSEYDAKPGFLRDFTQKEKEAIEIFESKSVEYNTLGSISYSVATYSDKVFIPSYKQCGFAAGTTEGSKAISASNIDAVVWWTKIKSEDYFAHTRSQSYTGISGRPCLKGNEEVDIAYFFPVSICLKRDTVVFAQSMADFCMWEVQA